MENQLVFKTLIRNILIISSRSTPIKTSLKPSKEANHYFSKKDTKINRGGWSSKHAWPANHQKIVRHDTNIDPPLKKLENNLLGIYIKNASMIVEDQLN
jgi:hypothetical protein